MEARSRNAGICSAIASIIYATGLGSNIIRCNLCRGADVLRQYIEAAMRRAKYTILGEDASYYGEIPGLEGVYANSPSLEGCRDELEEVLEEWVLFRVSRSLDVPTVGGVELKVRKVG